MRRFVLAVFVVVIATGVLSGSALAKEEGVELSSTPAGTHPGDPWTPTLLLVGGDAKMLAAAKPKIAIWKSGSDKVIDFPAKPTGTAGQYTVRVVFPEAGLWYYEAHDGFTGRAYQFPSVMIEAPAAPAAAPPPAKSDPSGFPVFPVTGGLALALAAGGLALFLRRQRMHARPATES